MRSQSRQFAIAAMLAALFVSRHAAAQYIPDRLFIAPRTDFDSMPDSTLDINGNSGFATIPIPSTLAVEETNLRAIGAPSGEPGGLFERNEHVMRFLTAAEAALPPGNPNRTGHQFQRNEAWDIAFDLKIEVPNGNVAPRKEAGFYFKAAGGNAMFIATSNDELYTDGPGEITTVFGNIIPGFNFTNPPGPLGDYNLNTTVDAADYVIWRKTLGTRDDGVDPPENMAANGNNEGESQDFIDQADWETWRMNFAMATAIDPTEYMVGQTIRMRMIYTPPVENPNIPFNPEDPGLNVMTPGTMEYQISLEGGPVVTSEPVSFDNIWKGLPNNTQVMLRVQNLSTASAAPDASKVTFSNIDVNGDAPGSGAGLVAATVPEPASGTFFALGILCWGVRRRRASRIG